MTLSRLFAMRSRIVLIIISLSIGIVAHGQPLKITLDQAIEIAKSESNTIKIADMTIEKTGYAQKGSYAALYPNINASASLQRTLKRQVMVMSMNGTPTEIEVGSSNNLGTGVSASAPLVNVALWESLKLSAVNVEMAVEQARSSKISMISQVKKAFFAVLLAEESLDVMTQIYENAKKNCDETVKLFNVGKASEYEKTRSQVTMMNAEPNVSSAANAVNLAIWQLKAVMGIDLDTEIEIVGNLGDYTGEMLSLYQNENDIERNSTLQQLGIQGRLIESNLKLLKSQYLPTLSASIGYNYNAMGNTFDMNWYPYSVAALSLSFPIFDGFDKHYSILQAKKDKDMLDLQIEDTRRNILISIQNYEDQIALCAKNYAAAKSTVDMAQKNYEISEKMYEVGKATLVEVNDAQLALTQSQLTMNQAIYNYMTAKASLDELIGKEE